MKLATRVGTSFTMRLSPFLAGRFVLLPEPVPLLCTTPRKRSFKLALGLGVVSTDTSTSRSSAPPGGTTVSPAGTVPPGVVGGSGEGDEAAARFLARLAAAVARPRSRLAIRCS